MSKEDIEVLRHGFEKLNIKMEKPKFYKIVRQPGRERLLFLQRCLSLLYGEGQEHYTITAANDLEEDKKLEEEIIKHVAAYGLCKKRRIVTPVFTTLLQGNGSEHDNLLFWKRVLALIQSYQASKNKDSNSEFKKSLRFMTELLQHPQLENVLQARKRQLPLDLTPDNSFSEVNLLQTKAHAIESDYCNMENSVQKQELNSSSICQRLNETSQLLQERIKEFKEASRSFPRMATTSLSCMGGTIEEQCGKLEQIRNRHDCLHRQPLQDAYYVTMMIISGSSSTTCSIRIMLENGGDHASKKDTN